MVERIVCAAIWYEDLPTQANLPVNVDKGIVVAGLRHGMCIGTVSALGGLRSVRFGPKSVGANYQGFITSENRFVDRRVAFKIAQQANQIIGRDGQGTPHCKGVLYSEDLY